MNLVLALLHPANNIYIINVSIEKHVFFTIMFYIFHTFNEYDRDVKDNNMDHVHVSLYSAEQHLLISVLWENFCT
jgi:hypothetical protein